MKPTVDPSAFVAESVTVIGKVAIDVDASIWFGAISRGDNETITVGRGSNIQEGCVLHTDPGYPMEIGANVTIGHQAIPNSVAAYFAACHLLQHARRPHLGGRGAAVAACKIDAC